MRITVPVKRYRFIYTTPLMKLYPSFAVTLSLVGYHYVKLETMGSCAYLRVSRKQWIFRNQEITILEESGSGQGMKKATDREEIQVRK